MGTRARGVGDLIAIRMSASSPKVEIGDFPAFKEWLGKHGPSTGTNGTYYAAMRTYQREFHEALDRNTLRSDRDVERIRQRVEKAIAQKATSISPLRLLRALIPGLNHYVNFVSETTSSATKGNLPAPHPATAYSFSDVINFARHHAGEPIYTIGERTTFTLQPRADDKGIRIQPTDSGKPAPFSGNDEFFDKFNELRSFKTTSYVGITRFSSYLLAILRNIIVERAGGALPTDLTLDEVEILAAPVTEREALRKSRVGQGQYRDDLISLRHRCYITGLALPEFLRASHLKPWRDSNNQERLDPHNGLLLVPNYDHLLDKGYISFSDDGRLLISPSLPAKVARCFAIPSTFQGTDIGPRTRAYLTYHREHLFRSK